MLRTAGKEPKSSKANDLGPQVPPSRQSVRGHVSNRALSKHLGQGTPLPTATRGTMEQQFGQSLGGVRVHADAAAGALAERQSANAFAFGSDIVFASGKFAPSTEAGDRLLAHEIAHTLQQTGSGMVGSETLEAEARGAAERVRSGGPVRRLSSSAVRLMRDGPAKKEPRRLHTGILFFAGSPKFTPDKMQKWVRAETDLDTDPEVINECAVQAIGKAGSANLVYRFNHPVLGRIVDLTALDDSGGSWSIDYFWLPPASPGGKGSAGAVGGSGKAKPDDKRKEGAANSIQEGTNLYEQVKEHLPKGPVNEGGEEEARFARFLQLNKDKIEGILPPGKKGEGITQAQVEKIIDLYGKFINAKPLDTPDTLETRADFDKVFAYDPNWQKMSKQDRQMMIDYAKMSPEDLAKGKFETSTLSQDMKEQMALRLADSWASEVWEAAKAAFTDAGFLISLVLTIAIYIGLWLTPDPTFITKLAAGALTAVMWAMFAWNDIWETMVEYDAFGQNVKRARTTAELKAAGNRLGRKIGAVGFDILMMIATWGLGKAASPKLKGFRAKAAERGVTRAESVQSAAAADPAAGVAKPAEGSAAKLLDTAKANAKGSTPTAVLDALESTLDPAAKEGLKSMRASGAGDAGTYKAIEGQTAKGNDVNHFLSEKAATPAAKSQAKATLLDAEAKVARAKLIQTETIADPKLRKSAREAQLNDLKNRFKATLREMGFLDDPKVKKAAENHNLKDLTSALGEAISRQQLTAGLPEGSRVVSNLALVKEVPGYTTIEAWKQATNASASDAAKIFQGKGQIYKGLGEIDNMVVEDVPNGKPRVSLIEEVKTGQNDQHLRAQEQITKKVLPAVDALNAGDTSVKVFELIGKKTLGAERTGTYDFTGKIGTQTRGPGGKAGFDKTLGFDPEVLDETAQSLIDDGLPPATGPKTTVPVTGPGAKDKDDK